MEERERGQRGRRRGRGSNRGRERKQLCAKIGKGKEILGRTRMGGKRRVGRIDGERKAVFLFYTYLVMSCDLM